MISTRAGATEDRSERAAAPANDRFFDSAASILLLIVIALAGPAGCRQPEPPRNLLIICIDTLRADHVGSYGYARDTTPDLDRLAGEGSRFTRAFATSSWTVPSVASVFTSRLPSDHGAGVAGDVKRLGNSSPPAPIQPSVQTLTDVFRAKDYRTGLFSANPFLYGEFKRSFDTAFVERTTAEKLVDAALRWLNEDTDARQFLYVQFMDVHPPNTPPEPYQRLFGTPEAGARGDQHTDWSYGNLTDPSDPAFQSFRAHRMALYDGSIRYIDAQIARLMDALEEMGVLEDTLVIVYSDHGEEFWDHATVQSEWRDDPRGIWGVGHGHTMFQELLHIPLILVHPGRQLEPLIECPASILDIAPTALALLGLEVPGAMEGKDLTRLLDASATCERRSLIAESPAYGPDSRTMIQWPMKLVDRGGRRTLHNLELDPQELRDLASDNRALVARMAAQLAAAASPATAASGIEIPEEAMEQLEALGYR